MNDRAGSLQNLPILTPAETGVVVVRAEEDLREPLLDALEREGFLDVDVVDDEVGGTSPRTLAVLCLDARQTSSHEGIRALRRHHGDGLLTIVVAHATHLGHARRVLRSAVRARAEGVVFADHLDVVLGPTARAVAAGQVVVPRLAQRQLAPSLSSREREVLGLAVRGASNTQIARALVLTESTVKSHLTSIFAKLGVASRSEAAALLLDPEETIGRSVFDSITPGLGDAEDPAAIGDWPLGPPPRP